MKHWIRLHERANFSDDTPVTIACAPPGWPEHVKKTWHGRWADRPSLDWRWIEIDLPDSVTADGDSISVRKDPSGDVTTMDEVRAASERSLLKNMRSGGLDEYLADMRTMMRYAAACLRENIDPRELADNAKQPTHVHELDRCPFCSGMATINITHDRHDAVFVACIDCGCRTKDIKGDSLAAQIEAVHRWNERA